MFDTILFGVLFTLVIYIVAYQIHKLLKLSFINPFLIAVVLAITILSILNITYEQYMVGGELIRFFLGPVTILLAVPLYKQYEIIKKNFLFFMIGTLFGAIVSFILVVFFSFVFGVTPILAISSLPKSITAPMALEVSKIIGGDVSLTMMMVSFTGLTGAAFGKLIVKVMKIKSPLAIGLALGSITHVIGTSVAIEIGEEEGAISSAAIGITGVVTVLILPTLIQIINILFPHIFS
ncbi:MAG: LrgB family protein [Tenericutes bacterium]|nr:LrgB family protein [Mycoplasmatota bacterium]